jgi:Ran GTPase-activating protein (RanGAP) involved in mRNA processing and transport
MYFTSGMGPINGNKKGKKNIQFWKKIASRKTPIRAIFCGRMVAGCFLERKLQESSGEDKSFGHQNESKTRFFAFSR